MYIDQSRRIASLLGPFVSQEQPTPEVQQSERSDGQHGTWNGILSTAADGSIIGTGVFDSFQWKYVWLCSTAYVFRWTAVGKEFTENCQVIFGNSTLEPSWQPDKHWKTIMKCIGVAREIIRWREFEERFHQEFIGMHDD